MIDCIFKLTLNKPVARWLNRRGLWMNRWMRCLAGGRCWEHERRLNLMEAQVFSFLHPFSLLSNSSSKAPRTKEISEDWRQPLSQPASTRERSLDKIKQHICWRQRRGGHIPLGTANAEWEPLTGTPFPFPQACSRGATDRGAFQTLPFHRISLCWAWQKEKA